MTWNTSKQVGRRAVMMLCLTAALFTLASGVAAAQPDDAAAGPSLVGTWTVQVTLRDCATGAPLGPPFNSLVTFHGHGTLSESAGSLAFAPGQRSPGHGSWTRTRGNSYGQEMIAMVLFDTPPNLPGTPTFDPTRPVSPGFFAGWQTVSHTVRFTGDYVIASPGTNRFYKMNGDVYRSGCSTATGRRFQ
jgi:hypothetical protein